MGRFETTFADLDAAAKKDTSILVAYSGGKDSLAVMDMCCRAFQRVEAFFMYLIPGLESTETALLQAEARWGVKVRQYPHWLLRRLLFDGVYCQNSFRNDDLPEWKLMDVYRLAIAETGIPTIATGAKKADSLWRRRQMSSWCKDLLYPLKDWSKLDVLSYLKLRGLPEPASSGRSATGIDLSTPSLLWLHDTYPNDFRKLCEVFPFAEAVVWRRTYYGAAI